MYNVRVNAEFSPTNIHDPSYTSGTSPREGDLSEIHVVDIYRRKFLKTSSYCMTENVFFLDVMSRFFCGLN
jgi:hypothetical protein